MYSCHRLDKHKYDSGRGIDIAEARMQMKLMCRMLQKKERVFYYLHYLFDKSLLVISLLKTLDCTRRNIPNNKTSLEQIHLIRTTYILCQLQKLHNPS